MTTSATGSARETSTASDLSERIREAAARHVSMRIVGGGTWLDANRPVRASGELSTATLTGIVDYVPGDLTLTARAGTTLDEIARVTAAHGQWLALDPCGDPRRSTIGATVATSSYGPLAHHFGTPRDMTLGLEFVTGIGTIARGGGRVVKNVAGFDLTRLVTGSWGSLGVITEVSVRLRALPVTQKTVVIDIAQTSDAVAAIGRQLRALPFFPFAVQLIDSALARTLGTRETGLALLMRVGGNEEAVRAQLRQLRSLGDPREHDPTVWDKLRIAESSRAAVVRLSRLRSQFVETWSDAIKLVARWPRAYCHGDPGLGVVRCVLPYDENVGTTGALRDLIGEQPRGVTRVFERLPDALWSVCAPGRADERLSRGIKRAFDPHRVLNPGILGDTE